jgi:hypothetical protein
MWRKNAFYIYKHSNMTKSHTYHLIFLGIIFLFSFGPPTYEKSEYQKWLTFHELQPTDFTKHGHDVERKMEWEEYNLGIESQKTFNPFRLYSKNATFFIDLDSYSLTIEKEENQLISYGSGVDRKVQVIRTDNNHSTTLLFCGTECYPETANWLNDHLVQILGFSLIENKFTPTIWAVDLNNMLFSEYYGTKVFNQIPKSYTELVRLKEIEFKN